MKIPHHFLDQMIDHLSQLKTVGFIMLGGSHVNDNADALSDYDIYIYSSDLIDPTIRKNIITPYCQCLELNNHYWETEDDGILADGIKFNLIYRQLDWISSQLRSVVFHHRASIGYTTCLWHNFITSKIIYDRSNQGAKLQQQFSTPYPTKLQYNIINLNYPILNQIQDSYRNQIISAINRQDVLAVHHRTTAYLASYFDILFASNKLTHPGEKRMVSHLNVHAKYLPDNFPSTVNKTIELSARPNSQLIKHIDQIAISLQQHLHETNLL